MFSIPDPGIGHASINLFEDRSVYIMLINIRVVREVVY